MSIDVVSLLLGGLIGFFCGLGSGYVVYRATRPRPALRLTHVATVVVGSTLAEVPDLKLSYKDSPIPSAARSTVVIWNDGNTSLRPEDVVPADPPRIEFSREVKVFPPTILQVSDSASGMSLRSSDDGSTFYLEFKYVAPRAGLAAQFVHTGTNLGVLTPAGRLVGDQYLEFGDPWNRRFPVVSGIVGLAGFFALIFLANSVSYGSVLVSLAFIFLFGGFGVMFVLTRYGSRWQIRPNNVLAAYVPAVGENLPKRGQLLKQASQGPTTKSKKTMR